MRPISKIELDDCVRRIPKDAHKHGDRYRVMRQPDYSQRYANYNDYSQGFRDMTHDTVEFRGDRGYLDGTPVHYWTYHGLIVRVDV